VYVGLASTDSGSGMAVVKDEAKNEILLSQSPNILPEGMTENAMVTTSETKN
jgi:hypothetical protein